MAPSDWPKNRRQTDPRETDAITLPNSDIAFCLWLSSVGLRSDGARDQQCEQSQGTHLEASHGTREVLTVGNGRFYYSAKLTLRLRMGGRARPKGPLE
jgi:hypothetical protein